MGKNNADARKKSAADVKRRNDADAKRKSAADARRRNDSDAKKKNAANAKRRNVRETFERMPSPPNESVKDLLANKEWRKKKRRESTNTNAISNKNALCWSASVWKGKLVDPTSNSISFLSTYYK